MPYLSVLVDELERSASARAAMAMLEDALARRSSTERGAFWHAIDLAYVSRKAPPETVAVPAASGADDGAVGPGVREGNASPRSRRAGPDTLRTAR